MLTRLGFLLSLLLALAAPGLAAQRAPGPTVGVVAGPLSSRQLLERDDDSDRHAGFLVGAWARVPTPRSWLTVTAEAAFVRRGGEYPGSPSLGAATVDVDYLALALLPGLRARVGPVELSAFAGPGLDVHLRSQSALSLQRAFRDPSTQVFAGVAGGGVALSRDRATFRLELRHREQLTSAFSGEMDGLTHRSTELVFRVGMRPRR